MKLNYNIYSNLSDVHKALIYHIYRDALITFEEPDSKKIISLLNSCQSEADIENMLFQEGMQEFIDFLCTILNV